MLYDDEDIKHKQLQENQIKVKLTEKQIAILQLLNNSQSQLQPLLKIFVTYNQEKNKITFFKILTDWKKVIDNTHKNTDILQLVKNQLWLNTQHFYQGRHHYHLQNNLARSQIDAYQLGMINYQRIKKGKQPIGDIIINPDNQYMLANLAWGQKIWSSYYKKCKEIQEAFNKGNQIINCNIGYKQELGQKPYSFSQILNWQKQHQND